MLHNSLTLHIKLNTPKLNNFYDQTIDFFIDNNINNSQILKDIHNLKKDTFDQSHMNNHPFESQLFFHENIGLETKLQFASEYYDSQHAASFRWFSLSFLFQTNHLAADPKFQELLSPFFQYSPEAKALITQLAARLFNHFNNGYLIFRNEYQEEISLQDTEDTIIKNKGNTLTEDEFEYALVPQNKLGMVFQSNCSCTTSQNGRQLCSKKFIKKPAC